MNNNFIFENYTNNNDIIINDLIKKYETELQNYKYIDNIGDFSLLKLKGSIRYINKYDNELRYGGILIKIYKNNYNKWIAILKNNNNKKYYINYNNNYIFYKTSNENNLLEWANIFINDINNNKYEIN